jgi:hypothetical protein
MYGPYTLTGLTPRVLCVLLHCVVVVAKLISLLVAARQHWRGVQVRERKARVPVRPLITLLPLFSTENVVSYSWSDSLAQNTIHANDFGFALVKSAAWASYLGSRSAILAAHSEDLPSTLTSDAPILPLLSHSPAPAKKDEEISAAVFCAVDDCETTQKEIATVIQEVVGVKSGFHGSVISGFAKLNLGDVVEDANDKVPRFFTGRLFPLLRH